LKYWKTILKSLNYLTKLLVEAKMNAKIILPIMLIALLAGCVVPVTPGTYTETSFDPDTKVTKITFSSADEFNSFIKANQGTGYAGGV